MKITVNDIRKIWSGGRAELVAGKAGLDREVLFYDMMEQPDVKPWLRKGILMITTGYAIRNDRNALLDLIRTLNEAGAAALAIKTRFFDDFPQAALELADQLKFPLFFLDNKAGFVEVVYPVMVAIVEARNNVEMRTRYQIGRVEKRELDRKFFFDLLQGKAGSEDEAQIRANSLNWPMLPVRLIQIGPADGKKTLTIPETERIRKMTEQFFQLENLKCVSMDSRERLFFLFEDPERNEAFRNRLENYIHDFNEKRKKKIFCGVSALIGIYQETAGETEKLLDLEEISRCVYADESVLWREDCAYEELMLRISRLPDVREYVQQRLSSLEDYDEKHATNLVQTLEIFLKNRGARKQTAEEMFLHRNTMMYRIKKMEELLGCSLSDAGVLKELEFACEIRPYLR